MENFDLTKLTERELRELNTKIGKEIMARKNFRKDELSRAIVQSIKAYTVEFGDLTIDVDNDRFYFPDGAKFDFIPEDDMIIVT